MRATRIVSWGVATALLFTGLIGCATQAPTPESDASRTPTPSQTESPPAEAIVRAYEFPAGMIEGAQGGGLLYTRVEGVIAVPSTPGPHPTVVFVHGSYPSCLDLPHDKLLTDEVLTTPWPEGCGEQRVVNEQGLTVGPDYLRTPASWSYLAQSLAERGFVVIVPDVNTKERMDWGGEPDPVALQTNLVKLHLDIAGRLSSGEDLGLSFAGDIVGKVDTSNVYLVGHSSGGGYVVAAAVGNAVPGLKGVVGIEPAITTTAKADSLVPTLLIAGECDEQIPAADVLEGGEALAASNPNAVVVTATIQHATHIAMLDGGGSHTIGLVTPVRTPACADGALLPEDEQRSQAAQMTASFLEQLARGTTSFVLPAMPGVAVTATSQTKAASVTVGTGSAEPERADPQSIRYVSSSRKWLPDKPADLVINQDGGI